MPRNDPPADGAIIFVTLLALLTFVAPARAAEGDELRAQTLFGEGRKLVDAGRYAEACPKFEESLRLDPGVGTSFNLADCHERIGRTASAWTRFLEVAAATNLVGQLEREKVARARAAALEPKLARLDVEVSVPADGLVVTRDGMPVGQTAWGAPVPVDPGAHLVEAGAPGRRSWSRTVEVTSHPGTVVVSVPALDLLPPSAPSAGVRASSAPDLLARPEAPAVPALRRRWLPVVVVGLGALGAAGAVSATLLALEVRSANADARILCLGPNDTCTRTEEKARHDGLVADARRDRILAIASGGVGAAALLGAAYLWWRAGHPRASARVSAVRIALTSRVPLGAELSFAW